MATVRTTWGPKRPVWCFDVETRPGPWGGGDFTFRSMLSIAAGFEDGPILYLAPGFSKGYLESFSPPSGKAASWWWAITRCVTICPC